MRNSATTGLSAQTRRELRHTIMKCLAANAVLAVSYLTLMPDSIHEFQSQPIVNHGDRPLIIVATNGGDRDQTLHVRLDIETKQQPRLLVSVTAKDIKYNEGWQAGGVDYRITFVGLPDPNVSCGGRPGPIPSATFDVLGTGTQLAMDVDALGGRASATNYSDKPDGTRSTAFDQQSFPAWTGKLRILDEGTSYSSRTTTNSRDDVVWVEECFLPAQSIWRVPDGQSTSAPDRQTLLVPQLNWTSLNERTDHQSNLDYQVYVPRTDGLQLGESYPQAGTLDWGWYYTPTQHWVGKAGERGNIAFTDQPVMIFNNQTAQDRKTIYFLWAGVILGTIAAIFVSLLSNLFEAGWRLIVDRE